MLGCHIRDRVEEARGRELDMRMVEHVDSYHVNSRSYPRFLALMKALDDNIVHGRRRMLNREDVVDGLEVARPEVEAAILAHTTDVFAERGYSGAQLDIEMKKEATRVHGIGDRIFHLLNKYPRK
jgi:hypothetical protein